MTITWADSFELDGNLTSFQRTYPTSTIPLSTILRASDGRYGGLCLQAGVDEASFTAAGAGGANAVVHFALKCYYPEPNHTLIDFGSISLKLQHRTKDGREWFFFTFHHEFEDRTIYTSDLYPLQTWMHFEISVTPSLMSMRVNGRTEVEDVEWEGGLQENVPFTLKGVDEVAFDGWVAIDDLVITSGERLGPVGVEPQHPFADANPNQWDAPPVPHAALIQDALGGTVDDDFTYLDLPNADGIFAETFDKIPLTRLRGQVMGVKFQVDAKLLSVGSKTLDFVTERRGENKTIVEGSVDVSSTGYARYSHISEGSGDPSPDALSGWVPEMLDSRTFGFEAFQASGASILRVTRFVAEVIALHQGEVTARPLPTSVLPALKINWSDPVRVKTAWQTDIAPSDDALSEDRRSLVTRPLRTVEGTVQGISQQTSAEALTTIARLCSQRNVVPIYPDVSQVVSSLTPTQFFIHASFRRFFTGQRALIVNKDTGSSQIGTIANAYYNLLSIPGITTPNPGDLVYPLIDCHVTMDGKTLLQTDETASANLKAVEMPGNSTLPPSWVGSLAGVFPHNDVGGKEPVFDLDPNWADGIRGGFQRVGDQGTQGKSIVTSTSGARGLWKHSFPILCRNRREFWRVLRFFDWARGRAKSFWLPGPAKPWELVEVPLTLDKVKVRYTGDPADIQYFDHIYCKVDSTYYIRPIATTADAGGGIIDIILGENMNILAAVVDVEDVEFGPAHLVRFEDDVLSELWLTDEICQLELRFTDVLAEQVVDVPDLDLPDPVNGSPEEIADLDFWFTSRHNCFYQVEQGWVRSKPIRDRKVDAIVDIRESVGDFVKDLPDKHIKLKDAGGAQQPYIAKPDTITINKGAPIVFNPVGYYNLHHDDSAKHLTQVERTPWSNLNGWTCFISCSGGTNPQVSNVMLVTEDGTISTACLRWYQTASQMIVDFYYPAGSHNPNHRITAPTLGYQTPIIMVLRWVPNTTIKLYFNGLSGAFGGGSPWTTVSPVSIMAVPSSFYGADTWLGPFNAWLANSPTNPDMVHVQRTWNSSNLLTDFLSYRRWLTDNEVNQVGQYLAAYTGAAWANL